METVWNTWAIAAGIVVVFLALGFNGAPLWLWTIATAGVLVWAGVPTPVLIVAAVVAAVFNLPPIRRVLVSSFVLKIMKALKLIPEIS